MTSYEEAREAVYREWGRDPTTKSVTFAGVAYPTHFDGEVGFRAPEGPWFRVSLTPPSPGGHTLGGTGQRRFLRKARIFVQVFVPATVEADGLGLVDRLMHAAAAVYEGRTVQPEGLRIFQADTRPTGAQGRLKGGLVELACDYEERK